MLLTFDALALPSSSQPPLPILTPEQIQAYNDIYKISVALEDMSKDLNNPNLSPTDKLAALTNDMGYLKQFSEDLGSISKGLTPYDQMMIKGLQPQVQNFLWLTPQDVLNQYNSKPPSSETDMSNALGFVAGQAFAIYESIKQSGL